MNSVFSWHHHQWEPYHLTEIIYFPGKNGKPEKSPHHRVFEACMVCGVCRVKDLVPSEVPPYLEKTKENNREDSR